MKTRKKKKRPVGRPKERVLPKLNEKLRQPKAAQKIIEGAVKAGNTDEMLAKILNVDRRTIHKWKADKEFRALLKKNKVTADKEIENSLFIRAHGYTVDEVTVDKDGVTRVVTKHIPADTGAMAFWLKNRKPTDWRDRHELDINAKLKNYNIDTSKLTLKQIDRLAAGEDPEIVLSGK